MTPPIKKLVLPASLVHVKPGELPASLLVDVKPFGKLHPLAANAYNAVRAAALARAIPTAAFHYNAKAFYSATS